MVKFNSIEPFIPSGKDFEASKALFLAFYILQLHKLFYL